ncbi:ABC transporter ATP-binding protein [Pusillimonas sp. DMV24BSW_D]|uniref:ABC transporter ATP-binding protein n=1 Tax=Neopusillimonas aestuarii TaxID=2716226 RepID=UPI000C37A63F|nr:ABC transporter ATP-binding protein [Pusillimonas sp. DMV24BSW_D]MBF24406.1 ABC transporter ATP-binding protein [Pusillimonas sp.]QIM49866.1 ABC transporter ATP-binding protein [Pusillimonas sp. DMV24BSW_D]
MSQPKPLLQVQGITKRFAGLTAVSQVSFDVPEGKIMGLIGPNGAGKTTCFQMIAGAMKPTQGSVVFDGRSLDGLNPEEICELGIARTFQVVRPLQEMTVLDNAMVGALLRAPSLDEARDLAASTLDQIGLGAKKDILAMHLTLPDRKMLELAKALATQPRLLLLDEVMAGLRPTEADEVIAVLRKLNGEGLTIVLVEHVMRILMSIADHVAVLHHGELITQGTPDAVTRDPRVIESYLGKGAKHGH